MDRRFGSRLGIALLFLLSLTSCGKVEKGPLAGKYHYIEGAAGGELVILDDKRYNFCTDQKSCEMGEYSLDVYDEEFDGIGFSGPVIRKFLNGHRGTVGYEGWRCPCIFYGTKVYLGPQFVRVSD
jgi:hypothetical protein